MKVNCMRCGDEGYTEPFRSGGRVICPVCKGESMKKYVVEFVVQTPDDKDLFDALNQAERYLNTGGRCVDCNVRALSADEGEANDSLIDTDRTLPHVAEYIGENR